MKTIYWTDNELKLFEAFGYKDLFINFDSFNGVQAYEYLAQRAFLNKTEGPAT